ncbi:MAG: RNA polymerase factor sigma-32 [Alphaproteobacteria bacterium]|nr:RNA polymerase factor sigma-32 [Alphaproteobacteria bacterium]
MARLDDTATQAANIRFIRKAMKTKLLARERELDLAKHWRESGDQAALDELIGAYSRMVVSAALKFRHYGLPVGDLIQEGHIGLMQAAARFEPSRDVRFATYAQWWIRAAIQDFVLRNWSIVRTGTTAAHKSLFFNLRRMKAQMRQLDEGDLPPEAVEKIATQLGVPEQDVVQMNRRLAAPDNSLNAPVRSDGDGDGEWQDWLVDETDNQEVRLAEDEEGKRRQALLDKALVTLNERERDILTERRLKDEPATLEDLSQKFGISRERVRQIEVRAFEKLQRAVKQNVLDEEGAKETASS